MDEENVRTVFAVYNCQSGENKIVKLLNSYPAAEDYAIKNCCNFKSGLQIRKVFTEKPKQN